MTQVDTPALAPRLDARPATVDPLRIVMPIAIGAVFLGAWEAAVRLYDAMCMRCGTDLEFPDEAEIIEPTPAMRVRAKL